MQENTLASVGGGDSKENNAPKVHEPIIIFVLSSDVFLYLVETTTVCFVSLASKGYGCPRHLRAMDALGI